MSIKLLNICGARPNFMKIAPLMEAYRDYPAIKPLIIHTGQHYDDNMSRLFFDELGIPRPDINLEVGSASHAQQTAAIMQAFEPVLLDTKPDAVLVVGDVNSTIACGLVAVKAGIPLIHVEAGLRSFDRTMPEEINRLLTDAISDLLFVSEPSGETNLLNEGIAREKIHFVGNVMIDTLHRHLDRARTSPIHNQLKITQGQYAVLTLHRPANVDDANVLKGIFKAIDEIQQQLPVVFCAHPRTQKQLERFGLWDDLNSRPGFILTPPLGYLDFLHLMSEAKIILTDSGGMQEEATILNVRCLTLRENTERPVTLANGTNRLVGSDPDRILAAFHEPPPAQPPAAPALWDGQAAQRIAAILAKHLS